MRTKIIFALTGATAAGHPMPPLREGDRIAFLNAGGYGASMSSNHCMRGELTERLL